MAHDPGIQPLLPCASLPPPRQANRMLVLFLTFICYTAYHASRKPPSIVKSVLHGEVGNAGVYVPGGDHYDRHWAASHAGGWGAPGWGGCVCVRVRVRVRVCLRGSDHYDQHWAASHAGEGVPLGLVCVC